MKLLRVTLVCSLLLLAASPAFAIACNSCTGDVYPYCESTPDSGTRCSFGVDTCETVDAPRCTGFAPESASATAVLAEWTVASVEVKRPADATTVVASADTVAVASLSHSAPQN